MPTLTLLQIRAQVQTDITDAAMQKIVDAEEKRIEKSAGKETAVTEYKLAGGLVEFFTQRPILTITSIKERRSATSTQVTLAADDYRIFGDRLIRRLSDGTNGFEFWGAEVEILYDPTENLDRRNLALVELVRISVEEKAVKSEKDGDVVTTYRNPQRARKELLDGLSDRLMIA